jgi:hypothetical protein
VWAFFLAASNDSQSRINDLVWVLYTSSLCAFQLVPANSSERRSAAHLASDQTQVDQGPFQHASSYLFAQCTNFAKIHERHIELLDGTQ